MKKLIVIVLLLVPVFMTVVSVRAQNHILINRTDKQTGVLIQQELVSPVDRNIFFMESALQAAKSFGIILEANSFTFPKTADAVINGDLSNRTKDTIKLIFERTHVRVPNNWSSSICLGLCFATFVDTLPQGSAYDLYTGFGTKQFQFHVLPDPNATVSDSLIDYVKLIALTGNPADTLSFLMKGILIPESGVTDQQPKNLTSGPKITAIYPSPLISGDVIKVKISSPRESNISYSIYDGIGRVVALGSTRQHIGLGDNTIKISALDGLANGSYMLKLSFSDGSSDTHFFQIMK